MSNNFSVFLKKRQRRRENLIFSPLMEMATWTPETGSIRRDYRSAPITFDDNDIAYLWHFPDDQWATALSARFNQVIFDHDILLKQRHIIEMIKKYQKDNSLTPRERYKKVNTIFSVNPEEKKYLQDNLSIQLQQERNLGLKRNRTLLYHPIELDWKDELPPNVPFRTTIDPKTEQITKELWSVKQAQKAVNFDQRLKANGFDRNVWSLVRINYPKGGAKSKGDPAGQAGTQAWYFVKTNVGALHTKLTKPVNDAGIANFDNTLASRKKYLQKYGANGLDLGHAVATWIKEDKKKNAVLPAEQLAKFYEGEDPQFAGIGFVGMTSETAGTQIHNWLKRIKEGFYFADETIDPNIIKAINAYNKAVGAGEQGTPALKQQIANKYNVDPQKLRQYKNNTERQKYKNNKWRNSELKQFGFGGGRSPEAPPTLDWLLSSDNEKPTTTISKEYLAVDQQREEQITNWLNKGRQNAIQGYLKTVTETTSPTARPSAFAPQDRFGKIISSEAIGKQNIPQISNNMLYQMTSIGRTFPSLRYSAKDKSMTVKTSTKFTPVLVPSATLESRATNQWEQKQDFFAQLNNSTQNEEIKNQLIKALSNPSQIQAKITQLEKMLPEVSKSKEKLIEFLKRKLSFLKTLNEAGEQHMGAEYESALDEQRPINQNTIRQAWPKLVSQSREQSRKIKQSPLYDEMDHLYGVTHPDFASLGTKTSGGWWTTKGAKAAIGMPGAEQQWRELKPYFGIRHEDATSHIRSWKNNTRKEQVIYLAKAYAQVTQGEIYQQIKKDQKRLKNIRQMGDTRQIKLIKDRIKFLTGYSQTALDDASASAFVKMEATIVDLLNKRQQYSSTGKELIELMIERYHVGQQLDPQLKKRVEDKLVVLQSNAENGKNESELHFNRINSRINKIKTAGTPVDLPDLKLNQNLDHIQKLADMMRQYVIEFEEQLKIIKKGSFQPTKPTVKTEAIDNVKSEEQELRNQSYRLNQEIKMLKEKFDVLSDEVERLASQSVKPNIWAPEVGVEGPISMALREFFNSNKPMAAFLKERAFELEKAAEQQVINNMGRGTIARYKQAMQSGNEADKLQYGYETWNQIKRIATSFIGSVAQQDFGLGTRRQIEAGELTPAGKAFHDGEIIGKKWRNIKTDIDALIRGETGASPEALVKQWSDLKELFELKKREVERMESEESASYFDGSKNATIKSKDGEYEFTSNPATQALASIMVGDKLTIELLSGMYKAIGFSEKDSEKIAIYAAVHNPNYNPFTIEAADLNKLIALSRTHVRTPEEQSELNAARAKITKNIPWDAEEYKRKEIAQFMRGIQSDAPIPKIDNLSTKKSTKSKAQKLLEDYQRIYTTYHKSDVPTFETSLTGRQLAIQIYNEQKESKNKKYTSNNMTERMIRDFILAYFLPGKEIFYKYTDQELNIKRKKYDPRFNVRLTPVEQSHRYADANLTKTQNNLWLNELKNPKIRQRINYTFAHCILLRQFVTQYIMGRRNPTHYNSKTGLATEYKVDQIVKDELSKIWKESQQYWSQEVDNEGNSQWYTNVPLQQCKASHYCKKIECVYHSIKPPMKLLTLYDDPLKIKN